MSKKYINSIVYLILIIIFQQIIFAWKLVIDEFYNDINNDNNRFCKSLNNNNSYASIANNPVENNLKLIIQENIDKNAKYIIFNNDGKIIKKNNIVLNTGLNSFDINVQQLSKGYYTIVIQSENKRISESIHFIKL